mmetsp:Transcript_22515/g.50897  ORF Transcript_22515/g.50897 Transcript_22515/m.50897 type:complete len:182 (-) Transcript_22515:173-718(-)
MQLPPPSSSPSPPPLPAPPPPPPAPPPGPCHHIFLLHPHALTVDTCGVSLFGQFQSRCSDEDLHVAAVRCCKSDGTCAGSVCAADAVNAAGPMAVRPLTPVNGASASYYEATDEYRANDWRLCTADEVGSCCDGSCGYDGEMDWSTSNERRASSTWSWPLIRAAGTIYVSRRSFVVRMFRA